MRIFSPLDRRAMVWSRHRYIDYMGCATALVVAGALLYYWVGAS